MGRVNRVRHICDLPDKRVEEAQISLDRPVSKAILDVGSSIAIFPHNLKEHVDKIITTFGWNEKELINGKTVR